ncbi:hypothetical protein GJ496_004048 [Pomphorhynchus laevis]|nr:hypothetical protein GJ496_004048 [Pomphorhynchus laevis]
MGCCHCKKKLSDNDLNFLLENTDFSRQQILQWYNDFMNDCPKGTLSKKSFLKAYMQFFPECDANNFCDHIFRAFDVDRSGQIDFKEFLMAINITSKGDPKSKLIWAFRMYDIDGNGLIDLNEMHKIVQISLQSMQNRVKIDYHLLYECRFLFLFRQYAIIVHTLLLLSPPLNVYLCTSISTTHNLILKIHCHFLDDLFLSNRDFTAFIPLSVIMDVNNDSTSIVNNKTIVNQND